MRFQSWHTVQYVFTFSFLSCRALFWPRWVVFKWFHVLLSNSNISVCSVLSNFKYCYLTQIILFKIIPSFKHSWIVSSRVNDKNCFLWPIDWTVRCTITPGQSGVVFKNYEVLLTIPKSSKTGSSPSDYLL